MTRKIHYLTLFCFLTITIIKAQIATDSQELSQEQLCEIQLTKNLDFVINGSLANEQVLYNEIAQFEPCGLDDFDIQFFANMDIFSTMIARLSKEKKVKDMTFNDLYNEIIKFQKTDLYKEIREVTIASEKLGNTQAKLSNWERDKVIFEELGASQVVIEKMHQYLKKHPNNVKTYQEILESF